MLINDLDIFVCPHCKQKMTITVDSQENEEIISGTLRCPSNICFRIEKGLPDLMFPLQMEKSDAEITQWYNANADVYDEFLPLTFNTFREDENAVRHGLIDKLELKPDYKVLEVGAGTGRDSVIIAEKLSAKGELHLQDICAAIFSKCPEKMKRFEVPVKYHLGNACNLPFPDNYFDASFHFGGLNTFSDIPGFFREMNRVTKIGGKVVVGDESMPEWLRNTEFGQILMNSNPHYKYGLPLAHLPVSCRNVKLEWIIGGVFYVIDYRVGEGEPYADFDFPIPGPRGGTHRTRFHGHLEGVTMETKKLAREAMAASGKSMHQWLDEVVKNAAIKTLEQKK